MVPDKSLSDLACFGGAPAASSPLHVNRPNTGDRAEFDALVDGIFASRWFTNAGPLVDRFEAELASFLGIDHVVVMSQRHHSFGCAGARDGSEGRGGSALLHLHLIAAHPDARRDQACVLRY